MDVPGCTDDDRVIAMDGDDVGARVTLVSSTALGLTACCWCCARATESEDVSAGDGRARDALRADGEPEMRPSEPEPAGEEAGGTSEARTIDPGVAGAAEAADRADTGTGVWGERTCEVMGPVEA
jgi:hypothetical protein